MKNPTRLLLTLVATPLMAGCFTVARVPVPATAPEREDVSLHGVVVRQTGGGESVVEFDELLESTWTSTSLSVVADVTDEGGKRTITELYPIQTLSGLLVRQIDGGKTSAIIGGAIVGLAAIIAGAVSGGGGVSGPG